MIRFTQGDMFETPADIRVNTVNCVGVMGAGVALAFKERLPEMFKEYKQECAAERIRPGKLHVWRNLSDWVINFPTKRHWRENSRYEDIESGLVALREYLQPLGPVKLALPALGCGHGGLDWARVSGMIREHLDGLEAEIIVFDPADSRKVAKKGKPATSASWAVVAANGEAFPRRLAGSGIRELTFSAKTAPPAWDCDLALFLSSKPDEREIAAATGCVQELARPGLKVSLIMGTAASTQLAALILEQGGYVNGWVPQGLDRFKTPQVLSSAFAEGRLSLLSVAKPHQSWNPGFATQSSMAALCLAKASLFIDPAPRWLPDLVSSEHLAMRAPLFFIRYQTASPELTHQWQELQARAIGRRSADGRPNMEPILAVIMPLAHESLPNAVTSLSQNQEPESVQREEPATYQTTPASMSQTYPKRLIEVDLPIRRISAHARREKSIRHGHISTLHIWWARRPLAACRAVICASLWPDPADPLCPAAFFEAAKNEMQAWTTHERQSLLSEESRKRFAPARTNSAAFDDPVELRRALLDFIADFANWDSSTVREYLDTSRALTQSAHEALGGVQGTRPLVVDPFAGGGSIPFEALRIGADAFASDLNPIPVLLNKVVLEYIPKYGQRLADEVRKWGEWIKVEAEKELSAFYPKDADGATPIAYLWARTIQCEGPGCGAEVPLIRSLWLSKKLNRSVGLQLVPNKKAKRVDFQIIVKQRGGWVDQDNAETKIESPNFDGTVKRGSATCPCCGYTTGVARVRIQLKARRGGANTAQLFCVVTTNPAKVGRVYRLPIQTDLDFVIRAGEELGRRIKAHNGPLSLVPDEPTPMGGGSGAGRAFSQRNYGMDDFADLFTSRQLLALSTLAQLVKIAGKTLATEMDKGAASAVQTCLALALSRLSERTCSLCRWRPQADQEKVENVFSRQALPMMWDFAEGSFLSERTAGWNDAYEPPARLIEAFATLGLHEGSAVASSATVHPLPDDAAQLFATDPPYYDAVPYSDLSDFFFVWLKRCLPLADANPFSGNVTPKADECIVDEVKGKDAAYFETTMKKAMAEGRRVLAPNGIGIVVFAHKSTAGWEAQLQAMIEAGWIMTGSWPIDTEMGNRLRAMDSAALASSVHLICRPRENTDGSMNKDEIGDWRDVLQELPRRIHEWMPRLAQEGVVGADSIFACLGPALEVFSRYSRVEKSNGDAVPLKDYLEHVWAAVSKEALSVIFEGADTEGFEPDARLTAMWLWTLAGPAKNPNATDDKADDEPDEEDEGSGKKGKKKGGFTLEYDAARKIAQGLGAHLDDLKNMVEVSGETARLLPVAERTAYLFGKEQAEEPVTTKRKKKQDIQPDLFAELAQEGVTEKVWMEKTVSKIGETTLDRIHQSMILFAASRSEALKRFLVDDGAGKDARFWRLANALSALYPPKCDEKRWVDGVLARKKGLGL